MMTRRPPRRLALAAATGLTSAALLMSPAPRAVRAATPDAARAPAPSATVSPQSQQAQALIDRGLAYLKSQQKPDGSWQTEKDPPAITAIVLKAFVQDAKYDASTDFVKRG